MADKKHPKTKVRFDSKVFPEFKIYYTVKLRKKDFRKTREQHFYIANKMLYKNILSSSRVRVKAGTLQLVDYDVHSKTSHIGGYSIWGGK